MVNKVPDMKINEGLQGIRCQRGDRERGNRHRGGEETDTGSEGGLKRKNLMQDERGGKKKSSEET